MRGGRKQSILGGFLVAVGLLLLLPGGAYYANGLFAKSKLDDLAYSAERPPQRTLDPQRERTPTTGAAVPVPQSPEDLRTETAAVVGDESPQAGTALRIAPPAGPAASNSPALEAPTDRSTASLVVAQASTGPVAAQTSAEPVVIQVDASPVVIRVAAEVTRTQYVDGTARSGVPASGHVSTGSQWAWRGVPDTSGGMSQFRDDEIAGRGPPIAYANPAEKSAPDPGPPVAVQVEPSTEPAVAVEPVAENAVLAPADPVEALVATYGKLDVLDSYDVSAAARIRIPAIGLTSAVQALRMVFAGLGPAWDSPDNVVGHIPTTARPGAAGQGWYFGHLDSPIRGEGNVFRRLPQIPELVQDGAVYIFVDTDSHSYAYQVYKTEVVHQSRMKVSDSGQQDITLVTCVPRFYYDHRLLVTAALVGVKLNEPHP